MKYLHLTEVHNTRAAEVIIPLLISKYNPSSIIDYGCGIGTWIKVSIELGIENSIGIDGDYIPLENLVIDPKYFISFDLENQFSIDKKFDLVISLEVAEHISPKNADTFIKSLTNLGDIIVFSAAIPGQEGQNHFNEQWPEYWIEKFEKQDFFIDYDIREEIWNNIAVDWWYKQNIILFRKGKKENFVIEPKIRKELYIKKMEEIKEFRYKYYSILKGNIPIFLALKILIKSIFTRKNKK